MYFYKTAVSSHFKIGSSVSLSKSAILSGFQNRRFVSHPKIFSRSPKVLTKPSNCSSLQEKTSFNRRNKQDGRPPPEYFPHSYFGKDAFQTHERFFCEILSSYFLISYKFKKFDFSPKKSQLRWKMHFENYYHLIRILQQTCHLERFWKIQVFLEKHLYFIKKNSNVDYFEECYHFNRILRQICYNLVMKNFSRSETDTNVRSQTLSIGKSM